MFLADIAHLNRVLKSPQPIITLHMLTEPFLLFLFSCIIPRCHHRTLDRAVDVIAAVHFLNVMGYCDTLCPPSKFFASAAAYYF